MNYSSILEAMGSLAVGFSEVLMTVRKFVLFVLEVNHGVMEGLLQFIVNLCSAVWAVIYFIFTLIYTLVVCCLDFLVELGNFIAAFLFLVWKLVVLLYRFLDLLFHFVESAAYFLWTGGKWTAETIRVSGNNLTENGLSTWKYFVLSLKEFSSSVIGGFSTIGYLVKTAGLYAYEGSVITYHYSCEILFAVDIFVRDFFRYIFDALYYLCTEYLVGLPQEAYIGILVSCLCCFMCRSLFRILTMEGLTFPIWSRHYVPNDYGNDDEDFVDRGAREFSDNEDLFETTLTDNDDDDYDYHQEEYSLNSDSSDGSSDDDDDDDGSFSDDEELEVNSDSDNESNPASESEMSEINIQLPDMNGPYDLRRSTTPSRVTQNMTTDDIERVIEREKERRMCVVCQDKTKSVLILPCRHMCLCVECGNHIARSRSRERRKCPLCRTKINTIMNVYL